MNHFAFRAYVPQTDADTVFARLSDFEALADHADVIRSITVTDLDGLTRTSAWEVDFYGGVLRWTERDDCDVAARRITFEQMSGDLAEFYGSWHVEPDSFGHGAQIRFDSDFDLGMPFIADVLDPIVIDGFTDTVTRLIRGLFGPDVDMAIDRSTAEGVPPNEPPRVHAFARKGVRAT
jgi:ribosome-associated toxin RatA of RatAB toxin-antitoxin module